MNNAFESSNVVSYSELVKKINSGMILNNNIAAAVNDFEFVNDIDYESEEFEDLCIYQYYMIARQDAEMLLKHTNELIMYSDSVDVYLWCITHYGTSWDCVYTEYRD